MRAAPSMVCFARYFKQGVVDNVRADVDLVIRRGEGPGVGAAAPKPKRARTAAAAAATNNAAVDPLEIHRFPAHSIILNESDYFRAQVNAWPARKQHCKSMALLMSVLLVTARCNETCSGGACLPGRRFWGLHLCVVVCAHKLWLRRQRRQQ